MSISGIKKTNGELLRIAFVSPHDFKGGASKIANYLFNGFREKGYDVRFFVGKKSLEDPDIEQLNTGLSTSLKLYSKVNKKIDRELGHEHFYYPNSAKSLMDWKPDLIHFHNIQGNYFDFTQLPDISQIIPVLFTLHDPWMFTGHCSYFIECNKWQTGCGNCPDLNRRPSLKRDGTAFNWKRKEEIYSKSKLYVATPSNWLLDECEKSILQQSLKISKVINNGVDTNIFKSLNNDILRERYNIDSDEIVLLYVVSSELEKNPYKDFDTISSALEYCKKNIMSNEKITFIALGSDGKNEINNNIRKIYIPFENDPNKISMYYNLADIYLHAARAENYPNVVMEALACGTPCVVTETGGVPEQIIEGKTGWVVPIRDSQAMAEKILELIRNRSLISSASLNANSWIEEEHTLEDMNNEYEKYYEKIYLDFHN